MARKLKVYRTPIGFHDAYVAAPSQKAALKAWGSDADLFARGFAELVTDENLTAGPLEHPGDVMRLRRGTDAENMAALPKAAKRSPKQKQVTADDDGENALPPRPVRRVRERSGADEQAEASPKREHAPSRKEPKPEPAPPPVKHASKRPSRARLDRAEAVLADAEAKHRGTIDALREQERVIQGKRRDLEQKHETETQRLEAAIAKARDAYGEALRAWRG